MSKFVNIAGQAITSTGTGSLTLGDPVPGYVSFSTAGVTDGDTVGYVIWDNFGSLGPESREVGRGTYTANTLTRDEVLTSTEVDPGLIDCTPTAQVYVAAVAEDIRSAYISDTPPTDPYNGQLWWDISTGTLYVYYRDGDSSQWVSSVNITGADVLPDQSGFAGRVLMTDGTDPYWGAGLPDQSGHSGQYLTTDGTTASWADVTALIEQPIVLSPDPAATPLESFVGIFPVLVATFYDRMDASQWQISSDATFTTVDHDTGTVLYEGVRQVSNQLDLNSDLGTETGGNFPNINTDFTSGVLYWRVRYRDAETGTWTTWSTGGGFDFEPSLMIATAIGSPGPGSGEYDSATDTGYYGFVSTADLISGNDLATQIGLTAGTAQYSDSGWFKFYVGPNAACNRTDPVRPYMIYVASMPYRNNLSWDAINGVTAVYGTRTETIGGNSYRVRLITGAEADPTAFVSGTACSDDPGINSEWNELFYRIHTAVPTCTDVTIGMEGGYSTTRHGGPQSAGANWAEYTNTQTGVLNTLNNGSACWAQESNGSNRVYRGNIGLADWRTHASSFANTNYGWRPVLEWVG